MKGGAEAGRDDAQRARQLRRITKRLSASFTGRDRGPDWSDDPKARVPHRDSYDEEDARAKPWSRIGDGSAGAGLAFREALLRVARELYHREWCALPLRRVRELRRERDTLSAELDGAELPIGRPAVIRQRLGIIAQDLARAQRRPRRVDLDVLDALLRLLNFRTGALFPSWETIAAKAGCSRSSVANALRRLKAHGLLQWVRRTVKTDRHGEAGPQREQTSNAYFFDHQRWMPRGMWQRFQQLLARKGARLAPPSSTSAAQPAAAPSPALAAVLDRLGAGVTRAST